jgi:hypothetical protein
VTPKTARARGRGGARRAVPCDSAGMEGARTILVAMDGHRLSFANNALEEVEARACGAVETISNCDTAWAGGRHLEPGRRHLFSIRAWWSHRCGVSTSVRRSGEPITPFDAGTLQSLFDWTCLYQCVAAISAGWPALSCG